MCCDPATKLSCDNCAVESVVIWPVASTAPLSTQKPCDGPGLSSSTSIGKDREALGLARREQLRRRKCLAGAGVDGRRHRGHYGRRRSVCHHDRRNGPDVGRAAESASLAAKSPIVPPLRLTPEDDVANAGGALAGEHGVVEHQRGQPGGGGVEDRDAAVVQARASGNQQAVSTRNRLVHGRESPSPEAPLTDGSWSAR